MNKLQNIKISLAAAFLFAAAGGAAAADFSELQFSRAADFKPAAAAVPAPAARNTLAVAGNTALLGEFKNSFGYKVNGHIRYDYKMELLHFYKLSGQPGYLMAQISDTTLPEFHNFIVLNAAQGGDTDYQVVYRFDSQEEAGYNAQTPAEKICSLDPECKRHNELKKGWDVREAQSAGAWEKFYFEDLKVRLAKKVGERFDSQRFAALGAQEVSGAKTRFERIMKKTGALPGGRTNIAAALEADWKTEACGATSADLMASLMQVSPAEQDRLLLKCGLYQDAQWAVKTEYDNSLTASLRDGCLAGTNSGVNGEYCSVYKAWDAVYRLKTKMEERGLAGGVVNF